MLRRCLAEAIGTFVLVAVGPGAAMVAARTGAFGHEGVALAFGLIVAAIVLRADAGGEIDVEAVREFARGILTPYKVPRRIYVVDELPTSLIGKVLRRQVRDRLLSLNTGV